MDNKMVFDSLLLRYLVAAAFSHQVKVTIVKPLKAVTKLSLLYTS